jgi:hypothetical protein
MSLGKMADVKYPLPCPAEIADSYACISNTPFFWSPTLGMDIVERIFVWFSQPVFLLLSAGISHGFQCG